MSLEKIPPKYAEEFNRFEGHDHKTALLYANQRLHAAGTSMRWSVRNEFRKLRTSRPKLVERITRRGIFVEPLDDELNTLDEEYLRLGVFNSGATIALVALNALGYEDGHRNREWADIWETLPEGFDAPAPIKTGHSMTASACREMGDCLIARGHGVLASVEQPYRDFLESVIDRYPEVHYEDQLFRGSFGYILGAGRSILDSMAFEGRIEREALTILPDSKGLDEGMRQLVRWDRKIAKAALRSSTIQQ